MTNSTFIRWFLTVFKPVGKNTTGDPDHRFISPDFRIRFVVRFCLFIILGGILFSGLILYFFSGTLTVTFENGRVLVEKSWLSVFPEILYANLIALVTTFMLVIVMTGYVFKRIRRPFFRLQEDIQKIAGGDFTQKIGRDQKDMTSGIADNINRMTNSFQAKIGELEDGLHGLIESASDLQLPDTLTEKLIRCQEKMQGFQGPEIRDKG